MCQTRDLGIQWPHWHTLIFSDETRIDVRFLFPRDVRKDAGAEGPIRKLEEVGSRARV